MIWVLMQMRLNKWSTQKGTFFQYYICDRKGNLGSGLKSVQRAGTRTEGWVKELLAQPLMSGFRARYLTSGSVNYTDPLTHEAFLGTARWRITDRPRNPQKLNRMQINECAFVNPNSVVAIAGLEITVHLRLTRRVRNSIKCNCDRSSKFSSSLNTISHHQTLSSCHGDRI